MEIYFKIQHFCTCEYIKIETTHENIQKSLNTLSKFTDRKNNLIVIHENAEKELKDLFLNVLITSFKNNERLILSTPNPLEESLNKLFNGNNNTGITLELSTDISQLKPYIEKVDESFIAILKRNKNSTS